MKWFLIVVLITLIMLIARAVSEQYKDKYIFYSNLKDFLNRFKLNLSFKQETINDFLDKTKPQKHFKLFIEEYKRYLKESKMDFGSLKILSEEEKSQLENLVKSIGNMDVKNEICQIDSFLLEVDIQLKQAELNKQKLCPMILKLSLLFGIGLAILLI